MIDDLKKGDIDIGILWGPMAGYYAKQSDPPLTVVPLLKETLGTPLMFRIGMAVRTSDQEWKRTLNRLIMENQDEINKLLISYNIPILMNRTLRSRPKRFPNGHDQGGCSHCTGDGHPRCLRSGGGSCRARGLSPR